MGGRVSRQEKMPKINQEAYVAAAEGITMVSIGACCVLLAVMEDRVIAASGSIEPELLLLIGAPADPASLPFGGVVVVVGMRAKASAAGAEGKTGLSLCGLGVPYRATSARTCSMRCPKLDEAGLAFRRLTWICNVDNALLSNSLIPTGGRGRTVSI